MTDRQKNNIFQSIISAILIVGTAIVVIAPQVSLIRKVSEYSVHIMLGLLVFSMVAMIADKTKIMFTGLACTAALCVFLKDASLNSLKLPESNAEPKINVAHINLSNITFEFNSIQDILAKEDIDLISFQELTPDWAEVLNDLLRWRYPYVKSEVRIDPYGMAIYSRLPFVVSDTFQCLGLPNMNVIIKKEHKEFQVISSYLTPALNTQSINQAALQLKVIASEIKKTNQPLLALGEYNMVYWTNEIREFRINSGLKNSRRDLADGNLRVPYDHIFFSEGLECTLFKELRDAKQNYIGIMGIYQIKDAEAFRTLNSQLSYN